MDAKTVFAAIALAILANGIVLAAIYRDIPVRLRPAALHWQIGTLLIAAGCIGFALDTGLPRWLMLTCVNGLFVFGLTYYASALRKFYGLPRKRWHVLPALIVTASIFWFSAIHPHFGIRVTVVSIFWVVLMCISIDALHKGAREDQSISRKILSIIFTIVMVYAVIRFAFYASIYFQKDFSIETGGSWLNLLSPIVMTLIPITGTTAFVLMCADYLRRQLAQAASTDYLTGLPNRRALMMRGTAMVQRAQSSGVGFAVAILDLDNFKAINDTYGHDVGDEGLAHIGNLLQAHIREGDMAARSGGEEFVIILDGLDTSGTLKVIQRLLDDLQSSPCRTLAGELYLTASAGIAAYMPTDLNFLALHRRADMALYDAKSSGRNRVELAS